MRVVAKFVDLLLSYLVLYFVNVGLCYQGFVEALLQLAKRMKVTLSNDRYTSLKSFLDYCEQNMDDERIKRSSGRAGRVGTDTYAL